MQWAINDPARFQKEQTNLDTLEAEAPWLSKTWRISEDALIAVDLDMNIHGRVFEGRMTYPSTFPDSPPYIRPRNDSEQWSTHQYGPGGSLCLQWRADNWDPNVTGSDLVRSAYELISTEQHPELPSFVPSAHNLTLGQSMRWELLRFMATGSFLEISSALPQGSVTRLNCIKVYSENALVIFVTSVSDSSGTLQGVPDVPEGLTKSSSVFAPNSEGWLFKSDSFTQRQTIESIDALIHVLQEAGFKTDNILVKESGQYKDSVIFLQGSDLGTLQVFRIHCGDEQKLHEYKVVLPSPSDIRLSDESLQLAGVRIGIVGVGSIGSKIAISLARSGARKFLLIDDDCLMPGNIVRHELDWVYVGTHKAWAVRDALALIAPEIEVDVKTTRIAGQESAVTAAAALKDLSNCDLLIDATANPEVFLLLAATARRHKIPLCWGEVFSGGYGGMIARARPKHDPNPLAVRDAIYAHLECLPEAPFKTSAGYDGNSEHPLIAYDSDVGFIATALTRLAIDTAFARTPSEFPYSAYLLGMRREWIFEAPFDTRPIDVQGDGWDLQVTTASEETTSATLEALMYMLDGKLNADADSSN